MRTKCSVCERVVNPTESLEGWFHLVDIVTGNWVNLCSPSCLVEHAWKLKEAQPKLSKSKYHCENCRKDPGFHSGPSLT